MMNTVGPASRKKTIKPIVAPPLMLLRNWIPRSTPEIAESTNSAVMVMMMTTPIVFEIVTSQRKFMPLLICSAPRPSDVAVPNSVAKIASPSMSLPIGRSLTRSPSSGANVALTRFLPPLRKVK